jgi:hypothetical protein
VPVEAAEEEVHEGAEQYSYLWAGDLLRHVGTAVHATFERIGKEGLERWDEARITAAEPYWRSVLVSLGVPSAEMPQALDRVKRAVVQTLGHERGRWILGAHAEAASEVALTGPVGGRVRHIKIDRTFVDEQGQRWIIDFKTAAHEGSDVEAFLDAERSRYEEQLRAYAALVEEFDSRPVRVGLYFPLLTGWREWSFQKAAQLSLFS